MIGLRFRRLLIFALAAGLARCSDAQESKKEELPHPNSLGELQKAMSDVIASNHVTGAGVALVSGGQVVWCGGIGKADIAANKDINCDTEFRVGSISKSFVALALLKLQEEGKIDLNAKLKDIAPEIVIKNPWDATNPVRVVNLLEHTAGFDDMSFSEVYNTHDPRDFPLLKVFSAHSAQQNPRWPPSTRFSYSNPGYGVAGYLIEKVSGQPFDVYIQQSILAPLGIARGDFRLTDVNKPFLAQGYQGRPAKAVPYKEIYLRPAGDMKASPGELAKLVQFFLQRGKVGDTDLVKSESLGRMEYPATPLSAQNGLKLGYGLANYTETEGTVVTHGHSGGIDGFISIYRYMPEQNWGYVILVNDISSGKALGDLNHLAVDFLSKDFPKPQQPSITLPTSGLQKFAGYYEPRDPRNELFRFMGNLTGGIRINAVDGKLTHSGLFGKAETLYPVAGNLFRHEKDPVATAVFFTDTSGNMIFSASGIDGGYAERISPIWPYVRLLVLAGCVALLASSLVFALIWLAMLLIGKLKDVKHLSVRIVPFLASLCVLILFFSFGKAIGEIGNAGLWSVTFFVVSLLFAALSIVGLLLATSVIRTEIRPAVRIHSFLVSLACCVLAVFLASWHLIGLRFWAP
ncbi:MAG TPA: serine hydrolase [Candidatus Saccharimonadales bacterium]|nr:serine hydrolase [Candidatus Saccharimonadales bacterium]